jgi:hypothetical protein
MIPDLKITVKVRRRDTRDSLLSPLIPIFPTHRRNRSSKSSIQVSRYTMRVLPRADVSPLPYGRCDVALQRYLRSAQRVLLSARPDRQDREGGASSIHLVLSSSVADYLLSHPSQRTKITLSHPLLPQLSQRGSPNLTATAKAMGKDFVSCIHRTPFQRGLTIFVAADPLQMIEEKLDGERIQIHRIKGNQYYVWSRKGKDYTYLYGKNQHEGSLIPFIHNAFREDVAE